MRNIHRFASLLVLITLSILLVACGSDDSATSEVPEVNTDVSVGEAKTQSKKTSARRTTGGGSGEAGSTPAVKSALAKVEAALDAGNYTAAVDIVLKTQMDPADQRVAYGMVTDEVTDAMASGDANATKAYQTMNQVRLMRQRSGR
ncbi:MAG TPA: hypothetical protein DCR17_08670 [Verrucomicrobiales bacterium]|nr:hypothetical protein [Verrucomicrobiales bacterium]